MTDLQRMLALLRERGERGAHTSEIRKLGISGNPSQRRIEALDLGFDISSERESYTDLAGKTRPGARFVLLGEPESDAGCGGDTRSEAKPSPSLGSAPVAAAPSAEPEPPSLFAAPEPVESRRYLDHDAWDDAA